MDLSHPILDNPPAMPDHLVIENNPFFTDNNMKLETQKHAPTLPMDLS